MDIQLYGRTGYKGRADLRTQDTGPMDIAELPAGCGHLSPGGTEQRPRLGIRKASLFARDWALLGYARRPAPRRE